MEGPCRKRPKAMSCPPPRCSRRPTGRDRAGRSRADADRDGRIRAGRICRADGVHDPYAAMTAVPAATSVQPSLVSDRSPPMRASSRRSKAPCPRGNGAARLRKDQGARLRPGPFQLQMRRFLRTVLPNTSSVRQGSRECRIMPSANRNCSTRSTDAGRTEPPSRAWGAGRCGVADADRCAARRPRRGDDRRGRPGPAEMLRGPCAGPTWNAASAALPRPAPLRVPAAAKAAAKPAGAKPRPPSAKQATVPRTPPTASPPRRARRTCGRNRTAFPSAVQRRARPGRRRGRPATTATAGDDKAQKSAKQAPARPRRMPPRPSRRKKPRPPARRSARPPSRPEGRGQSRQGREKEAAKTRAAPPARPNVRREPEAKAARKSAKARQGQAAKASRPKPSLPRNPSRRSPSDRPPAHRARADERPVAMMTLSRHLGAAVVALFCVAAPLSARPAIDAAHGLPPPDVRRPALQR